MLVVTSSVGYTCGVQCGVVDVSYQNKPLLLCLGGMWGGGAVCGVFRGKPCKIWDLLTAQATMPCALFPWVCLFSCSIPFHGFPLHFDHGSFLRKTVT